MSISVRILLLFVAMSASATPKPISEAQKTMAENQRDSYRSAVFAGGCFWCMEKPFDELDGVMSTTSGYTGGHKKNPTYKQVSAGHTGHYEVVKVVYNPEKVSYKSLLEVFWRNVDPVDGSGQFCDKGQQYLSAIFFANEEEQKMAQSSLEALEKKGSLSGEIKEGAIKTQILPQARFYAAEEYHQDYYKKNPLRYRFYRGGCGRDKRLNALWGENK